MVGKIVASVVSLLLVLDIVSGWEIDEVYVPPPTSSDPVINFCAPTEFKDLCVATISEVAKKGRTGQNDFLLAVFTTTRAEVESAKQRISSIPIDQSKDPFSYKCAKSACPDVLDYALDAFDNALKNVAQEPDELLVLMGGATSFQSECIENFRNLQLKKQVEDILNNSKMLTNNIIKIAYRLEKMMEFAQGPELDPEEYEEYEENEEFTLAPIGPRGFKLT